MLIGVVIGIVMAIMRISPNPAMSGVSWFYIWFFRGLPRYTLLFVFAFTLKALYADITIGIPFANVVFTSFDANSLTLVQVAVIALGLSEGAYMAEIVRAGLISVDQGQTEAAQALGLSRLQTLRHVVLPQAMRVIVPPTGNEAISMVKDSALVAAIALADLQFAANAFKAKTYKVVPFDVIVVIWFLVLTSALYVVQYYLERRFGRGAARELPPTPRQRLVAAWRKWRPRQGEAAA
jgi:polar amino acid transport system permease protein